MSGGLLDSISDAVDERRIYGAVVAQVVSNTDHTGTGRVQIRVPWLPDNDPWARVAVLSAGSDRGTYFIPQVDDEVLVVFANGDVREPFVVGSLWNSTDKPPATGERDPASKRIIKSPANHTIELDDDNESITITSSTEQSITIDSQQIEIKTKGGSAKLTMTTSGDITLEGSTSITLKAPQITLDGSTLDLAADATATLKSSGECTIQGSLVSIN